MCQFDVTSVEMIFREIPVNILSLTFGGDAGFELVRETISTSVRQNLNYKM